MLAEKNSISDNAIPTIENQPNKSNIILYKKIIISLSIILSAIAPLLRLSDQYHYNGSLSLWTVYDWLINYQGGFIRRGFAGEIIYLTASLTHISPLYILLFLQIFLITSLFYNTWQILLKQQDIVRHLIVMFSPAFFASFLDSNILERKDALYFTIISYLARLYIEQRFSKIKQIIYFCIVYPALILTHEIFFALLPYSLFFIKNKKTALIYSIPSMLTFAIIIFHHHITPHIQAKQQVQDIISSYHKFGIYLANAGALNWLEFSTIQGFHYMEYYYFRNFLWLVFLLLSIYNIIILVIFYKNRFNKRTIAYTAFSILLMMPVFLVATDWARFIIFECVSLWFILLTNYTEVSTIFLKLDNILINQIPKVLILLNLLFIYGGILGVNLAVSFPNATLGYLTNSAYNILRDKHSAYQYNLAKLQLGCKVVKCPPSYAQNLKKIMQATPLQHMNMTDLKTFYLLTCFVQPNPYLNYVKADQYCYKITNRISQAVNLSRHKAKTNILK